MALVKLLFIPLIISFGLETLSYACSLTEEDMVELRRYMRSKCESDLVVSEELFGFPDLEGAIREASTLGGNLGAAANNVVMVRKLPESRREFSRLGAFGGRLHMASIVSAGCTKVKFNKDLGDLVKMELPDQMEALNIGGKSICNSAEKKLTEFREPEFTGECSNESVLAYPEKKIEINFSRNPAQATFKSKGDPTAAGETRRPITVDYKNMRIIYSLPFVDPNGKLLEVSAAQKNSVEEQIRSNLEEFIQMHDCCTVGPKSPEEKKICSRFNLKYVTQKAKNKSPGKPGVK
ncbi:MAG: hypothetical protein SGJ18_08030 [Pseudomonadota bacterium]|nr:hypothetical protein [Pseudomonadota bacterium]